MPKPYAGKKHDQLVGEILVALSQSGLCKVWEQPTGAAFRDGQMIRYGLKGCADITGILFDGRRIEIEVKTGNAQQHGNQPAFERMIRKFGGIYILVRSVEDAVSKIEELSCKS